MRQLLLATLLTAAALSGQQPGKQTSQARVLTNAEFETLLLKPVQLLIVDVRRPDEIKDIGGFPVYLNVQIGDLERSLPWIPKERIIVTVSNHASRGGQAADLLTKAGFHIAGTIGAQTYQEAGGKLTQITPPPAASSSAKK